MKTKQPHRAIKTSSFIRTGFEQTDSGERSKRVTVFTKLNIWERRGCSAGGMCAEEVCDARRGVCVHVSVPLMHSCGGWVFPILPPSRVPGTRRASGRPVTEARHVEGTGGFKAMLHNPSQASVYMPPPPRPSPLFGTERKV